ncbi:mevalonate kinase family protein [Streptomyces sp. NPDC054933]
MTARPASRAVTVSVPGRLCLAGESLDWMTGGSSVVTAVPLRTRVTAWRAVGSTALALTSGPPLFRTRLVPAAQAAGRHYDGHVLDHMQAAARVSLRQTELIAGTVLTASTELPVAAGLSSSAALTLGVVAALGGLTGDPLELARVCGLARQAETGDLGSGAGWMDFLACAHGGVNRVNAGQVPTVERISPTLGIPVVVIDTLQRRTTMKVLASKRTRFEAREAAMVDYSRQAGELVDAVTEVLTATRVDHRQVGRLLNAGQDLLRDKVHCSTGLIDACAERVLTAGAFGAKLTGSGHGGCLFALVPDDALTSVLGSVSDLPVHAVALPASEPQGLLSSLPEPCIGTIPA